MPFAQLHNHESLWQCRPTISGPSDSRDFDAIVVAVGEPAHTGKVSGLTLVERGRRMLKKAGARQIVTVDGPASAAQLATTLTGARDVVVINCSEQVVHFPLLHAVQGGGRRVAITPGGDYAGALWVPAANLGEAIAAIAADPAGGDAKLAEAWRAEGVPTQAHGPIARHRAVTRAERKAASKYLYQMVFKPQDALLSKILFRPVAYPFTWLLLPTFVTPNMVTFMVAALGIVGAFIAAGPSYEAAVIGSFMGHFASYLDCTDGELARLKHQYSKWGQWYDTWADEGTTVTFTGCIGYHVYLRHADTGYGEYLLWSIPIGVLASLTTVYVIYYYLIKVARTGNSQDYPVKKGGLEWLAELTHRDFIGLASFIGCLLNLTEVVYGLLWVGAIVSSSILIREHLQLRRDLKSGAVVPRPKPVDPGA